MGCCNFDWVVSYTGFDCQIPIINECSRNGDTVIAWQYVFEDTDISDMLLFYESECIDGGQTNVKSIGDGLTLVKSDPELTYLDTLVFDEVLIDNRLPGRHVGFLKVIEPVDKPSVIIQFAISIDKKEVKVS